ncbi:PKD domain-containing protein [Pontibacter sp. G13]|uniref:PKD domain-containing protein n=1 Tax=Pontibacter sp. G13 TaxID=3074898 RepID=UPI00288A1D14|nr:PKD domain-containing protein [Pontibacter sp. G13]WNJ21000.1 PKD domain-containing protein [Pontibacter sp. G13]
MRFWIISWAIGLFCWIPLSVKAQLPPNQPEQDCSRAISLCQSTYIQTNSYRGAGKDPDEINGDYSCMLIGERNSVWYTFTVRTSGMLCFSIIPFDTLDDYDWALFDLTNADCGDIRNDPNIQIRCNWEYNQGCQGITGANGNTICPGQSEDCIQVQAGETYVLNVSNFSASNAGYTLDFSASSANLYDNVPPEVKSMTSFCQGVTVEFNENIQCSTVDSLDFTFSGPGGPYTISRVTSEWCDQGYGFDREFNLFLDPPITQPGNYTITLTGYVGDVCGNAAVSVSQQIYMPQPPNAAMLAVDPQCEEANLFSFVYTGASKIAGYDWNFGDGLRSSRANPIHSFAQFGEYDLRLAIIDENGCRDTVHQNVSVLPGPGAYFDISPIVCELDSVSFTNLTTNRGGYPPTSFEWEFGDGSRLTDFEPIFSFQSPGDHLVLLETYNALGCRDTFSRVIPVLPAPDVLFIPEEDVCMGDEVTLLNSSTMPLQVQEDVIESWFWLWGDGDTTFMDLAPTHTYDTAGIWPVTLVVQSNQGCVDSLTLDQPIYRPNVPALADIPICLGQPVTLLVETDSQTIPHWYHLPDGMESFRQGPTHRIEFLVYPDTFYLEAISEIGCISERVMLDIAPTPIPQGDILALDTLTPLTQPIEFIFETDGVPVQWAWNLGDGTRDTVATLSHLYPAPGRYRVRLEVVDTTGCANQFEQWIQVQPTGLPLVPNAFSPNGDEYNPIFFIPPHELSQFTCSIFSRNGQLIYQTDDPAINWRGVSSSGKSVPEGTYVYALQGIDPLGNPVQMSGTITLFR